MNKYNFLTITDIFYKQCRVRKERYVVCKCDCGNSKSIPYYNVINGKVKSCGCINSRKTYKVGDQFNKLTIVRIIDKDHAECLCDCGNSCFVYKGNLRNNHTKSCGCARQSDKLKAYYDSKRIELKSGQLIGSWTILKRVKSIKYKSQFQVQCSCGKIKEVGGIQLVKGLSKSCGHSRISSRRLHLEGKKFNSLFVIESAGSRHGESLWKVRCECGTIKNVVASKLISGHTTTCGGCTRASSKSETLFLDAIKELFQLKDLKTQYHLKNRFYDAYLPSKNMLIEVDCSYWHSTPKQKANDIYKTKLATDNGFKLVRFPVDSKKDGMKLIDNQFDLLKAILT
mgnify:CR=1 FL=1